jgi:DNA-binding MarR family transcriptional regulator
MTNIISVDYKEGMNEALSRRLSQAHFADSTQEALLSILATANMLNDVMDQLCEMYGITRSQYNVLRILRDVHPQGRPRYEIVRRMIDRAPDVTRLVDRLQTAGLVKRSRGDNDQRHAMASITAKGLKLLTRMQPEIDEVVGARFRLNAEECHQLSHLCGMILERESTD